MSSESFPCRILLARYPNTKRSASMVFDLPEPLGPTIAEKDCREMSLNVTSLEVSYLMERPYFLTPSITFEVHEH